MNFVIDKIKYSYDKKNYLFKDISFDIKDGEILAILGPNGVGKTTLLKCLLNLLKAEGNILLDGVKIDDYKKRNLYKKIAYVPQQRNIMSKIKVIDLVMTGRASYINVFGIPTEEDMRMCCEALEYVGMLQYKDRYCNTLSGGELQLVLIAKAIVVKPEIIILDEPESGLDFKNQLKILNIIEELSKKNIAFIFNTHYPKHALQKANKTLILGKNQYFYGDTKKCLTAENIEKIFGVKVLLSEMKVGNKIISNILPISVVE